MKINTLTIISILLMISLGCNPGDDRKQKLNDIEQAYQNAMNNHQAYVLAQDSLKASLAEWSNEHEVFTDDYQEEDTLEQAHLELQQQHIDLVEKHEEFVAKHARFLEEIRAMQENLSDGSGDSQPGPETVYKNIDQYSEMHKEMMLKHEKMEQKHNQYLMGQRTDLH